MTTKNNMNSEFSFNNWDYLGYIIAVNFSLISSIQSVIRPRYFVSIVGLTFTIAQLFICGIIIDKGDSVRRIKLNLPPRKEMRDLTLNDLSIIKQLFFIVKCPIFGIPIYISLIIANEVLIFIFGLYFGIDLLPTSIKVWYMAFLLVFVIPYYLILFRRYVAKRWEKSQENE